MPSQSNKSSPDLPAILGGTAVRVAGPPDWPAENPAVADVLQQAVADRSWGKYQADHCEQLMGELSAYHGSEHAVLCASGTVAIELALRGLKVGESPGDEVILAAYDFKGNFGDVVAVGATPVLVDIDADSWNLDPEQLEAAISENTKAIIASHLHGGIVPMPAVMEIARKHGIPVIEDACQVPGATVEGCIAGTWGDVGVFSFGGSKLLSAGRGGAFITNDADIVQRARLYSHRGNEAYPLSELQAAILVPQFEQLDDANRLRSENVKALCQLLSDQSGIVPFQNRDSESTPVFYKLGFQYDPSAFGGLSRDLFSRAMREEGIAIDPGFRSLHRIHSRRRFRAVGELPHANKADERVLVLHHPVLLGDDSDMRQIVTALDKIQKHATMIAQQKNESD